MTFEDARSRSSITVFPLSFSIVYCIMHGFFSSYSYSKGYGLEKKKLFLKLHNEILCPFSLTNIVAFVMTGDPWHSFS